MAVTRSDKKGSDDPTGQQGQPKAGQSPSTDRKPDGQDANAPPADSVDSQAGTKAECESQAAADKAPAEGDRDAGLPQAPPATDPPQGEGLAVETDSSGSGRKEVTQPQVPTEADKRQG